MKTFWALKEDPDMFLQEMRLADMLLSRPVLTIPAAQQMLGVSYPTARNQVEKLVAASILSPIDESSYGRLYAAGEILKILQ